MPLRELLCSIFSIWNYYRKAHQDLYIKKIKLFCCSSQSMCGYTARVLSWFVGETTVVLGSHTLCQNLGTKPEATALPGATHWRWEKHNGQCYTSRRGNLLKSFAHWRDHWPRRRAGWIINKIGESRAALGLANQPLICADFHTWGWRGINAGADWHTSLPHSIVLTKQHLCTAVQVLRRSFWIGGGGGWEGKL